MAELLWHRQTKEAATDTTAVLADTGEPFATVALRRRNEDGNRSQ